MKHGFTLLEVLIATAIASILTVTLFFSFNQIQNSVVKTNDTVDLLNAALLVDYVLQKDVSGAFIPVQAIPPKEQKKPADQKAQEPGKENPDQKKPQEKKPEQAEKKEDESKSKVPLLKDPFMSKNKGEHMQMLTFITANPMRVFWGEKTGEPKPSCVRVVYTLEEKKDRKKKKPLYTLYRQEGIKLDLGLYTKQDPEFERYMIADNIVACNLTFIVAVEKEKEQEEEKKDQKPKEPEKKEKPEIEIKEFKDWTYKEEKDVRTRLMVPDTVVMKLTLTTAGGTREESFVLRVDLATNLQEVPEQAQPRQAASQQPEKKEEKTDASKGAATQDQSNKKVAFVDGANRLVQQLRTQFGQA